MNSSFIPTPVMKAASFWVGITYPQEPRSPLMCHYGEVRTKIRAAGFCSHTFPPFLLVLSAPTGFHRA